MCRSCSSRTSWGDAARIWITLVIITICIVVLMKSCDPTPYNPSSYDRETCDRKARSASDYAQCVTATRRSVDQTAPRTTP